VLPLFGAALLYTFRMADAQTHDPFVVFVGLADSQFNEKVRSAISRTHGVLDLSEADDRYRRVPRIDAIVVPFAPSTFQESQFQALQSLPSERQKVPIYLVHLDDDRLTPWQDEIKKRQIISQRAYRIVQWSQFLGLFVRETAESPHGLDPSAIVSAAIAIAGVLLIPPLHEVSIAFDPAVTPEQIEATLTALANYYRACGGVGLSVEFENQEAISEEVHA